MAEPLPEPPALFPSAVRIDRGNRLQRYGPDQGSLGSVSFTTGALMSGNMMDGAVFGPGGTFKIMGDGQGGLPNGVIFSGTFTGNAHWVPTGTVGVSDSIFYTLSGSISGTWYNGQTVSGATTQITFDTAKMDIMVR